MNKQRYVDEQDEFFVESEKASKLGFIRHDTELFLDDSYIAHDVINARRIELPKGGEDWEVLKNKNTVLTLKGIRFTKQEREFLRTANGMLFIINGYKQGWKSVAEFKRQVKKCLK